ILKIGDGGWLMDSTSDAVSAELGKDCKARTAYFFLDHHSHFLNPNSMPGDTHSTLKSTLGATDQRSGLPRNLAHRDGHGSIYHEAVLFGCDVQLNNVAIMQFAIPRDAMYSFIVHADASMTWKIIDHSRSGARAILLHDFARNVIQFRSPYARADLPPHLFQDAMHNSADGL